MIRLLDAHPLLPCTFVVLAIACGTHDVHLGDGRRESIVSDGGSAPQKDAATERDGEAPAFETPVVIAGISADGTKDDDPSLTADLKELFFDSKRDGGKGKEDIWRTARADPGAEWEPPVLVDELDTAERETGLAVSSDGLTIWFSSDRPGGKGGLDVYVSRRNNRQVAWSEPAIVDELSSADDDLVSAVSEGGDVVFLARRTSAADDYDLFMANRADATAPWSEPTPIAELDTDAEESDAFLTSGVRDLLFTRSSDLYVARRNAGGVFTDVTRLDDLDSDEDDRDGWTTPAFDFVVFSSDRSGSYRLYEARRR